MQIVRVESTFGKPRGGEGAYSLYTGPSFHDLNQQRVFSPHFRRLVRGLSDVSKIEGQDQLDPECGATVGRFSPQQDQRKRAIQPSTRLTTRDRSFRNLPSRSSPLPQPRSAPDNPLLFPRIFIDFLALVFKQRIPQFLKFGFLFVVRCTEKFRE